MIVNGVESQPAVTTDAYQPHRAKETQLMRDGGLAQADPGGEVVDAELTGPQYIEDPDTSRVPEHAEGICQRLDVFGRQHVNV